MRENKTKTWLGILLASVILIQMSYHTIHVFSSHWSDSHIENTLHNTQIEKAAFACDLCAKLLGKTIYVWVFSFIIIVAAISILSEGKGLWIFISEFQPAGLPASDIRHLRHLAAGL